MDEERRERDENTKQTEVKGLTGAVRRGTKSKSEKAKRLQSEEGTGASKQASLGGLGEGKLSFSNKLDTVSLAALPTVF